MCKQRIWPAPASKKPEPAKVNVPLKDSDNTRARGLTELDRKFVTEVLVDCTGNFRFAGEQGDDFISAVQFFRDQRAQFHVDAQTFVACCSWLAVC